MARLGNRRLLLLSRCSPLACESGEDLKNDRRKARKLVLHQRYVGLVAYSG